MTPARAARKPARQPALCGSPRNSWPCQIIFPEGTRSPTGELGAFKPGIGFLTAASSIAVVPCFLEGAYRAWPKGAFVPRPRKLTLKIGEPMTFEDVAADKEGAKTVAARLREAVERVRESRPSP